MNTMTFCALKNSLSEHPARSLPRLRSLLHSFGELVYSETAVYATAKGDPRVLRHIGARPGQSTAAAK